MTKLYPHVIVEKHREFMRRQFNGSDPRFPASADMWLEDFYAPRVLQSLKVSQFYESLPNAVTFDFEDFAMRLDDKSYERNWSFAATLLSEESFALPFDDCLLLCAPNTAVRLVRDIAGEVHAFPMGCIQLQRSDKSLMWGDTIPLGRMSKLSRIRGIVESGEADTHPVPEVDCFLGDKGLKYFLGKGGDDTTTDLSVIHAVIDYSAIAFTCLAALMNPATEVIETEAPTKLNKARAQKGKVPISTRYTVTLRDKSLPRRSDVLGRTHASPEPHWRRGHIRRMRDKLIPVVPHVVGAQGADISAIGRKMYEMTCQRLNRNPSIERS